MGFKISWLGFSGKNKDEVLKALNLVDTGVHDEANESPVSVASIPNGWTIVWFDQFDHPFSEDKELRPLSMGCTLVAVQVHEGIMFSAAELYRDGARAWSASHDAQQGIYNLHTDGALPHAFEEIRARLTVEQDREGGKDAQVDCIFDIPVELAQSICGFRHDRFSFDWGEPIFTEAKEAVVK